MCSGATDQTGANESERSARAEDDYQSIFVGWVLSTHRVAEPVVSSAADYDPESSFEYWVRSRVVVERVWKGNPATVVEVWTPVSSDCDVTPVSGMRFIVRERIQSGRSIARKSVCDYQWASAVTAQRGRYTTAGLLMLGTIGALAAALLLVALRFFARRSASKRADA
jgi:hypothetical protein